MLKYTVSSPCPFPTSVCLLGNDYFSHLCCKKSPIWPLKRKINPGFVRNHGISPPCSSLVLGDACSIHCSATDCPHRLVHIIFSACSNRSEVAAFPLGKEDINRESKSNKDSTIFQYLRQIEIRVNVMRSLIF